MRLASSGGRKPREIDRARGDASAGRDSNGIEFVEQAKFARVRVVGEQAFAIFIVERVVDVRAEIEFQFFLRQIHFRGRFFADRVQIRQAIVQRRNKFVG